MKQDVVVDYDKLKEASESYGLSPDVPGEAYHVFVENEIKGLKCCPYEEDLCRKLADAIWLKYLGGGK